MKTTLLATLHRNQFKIGLSKRGLNSILIAFFSIICTSGFAQKVVDQQALQEKLTAVNEKIQQIDQNTATINARIAGIPSENVDPAVQVRLNDLQILKDQYIREKVSIEAALSSAQNSGTPNPIEDDFESPF